MPQLDASVQVEGREDVVAGEFRIGVEFRNASKELARLNTHQASHPALVLDVRDRNDKEILLSAPSAPDAADLEEGDVIAPGESVRIDYAGFLDRSIEPGEYRVRYFGEFAPLGGSKEDPLRSEWLTFTVRRARGFEPGIPIKGFKPSPEDARSERPRPPWPLFVEAIIRWLERWWRRLICLILRIFGGRTCQVLSQEIDQPRTETISNAPPGAEAWNGTYGWRARFLLTYDEPACVIRVLVRVRLAGTITAAQRSAWETSIEGRWNSMFKLCSDGCCCENGLPIATDIQFVTSNEHQVVNVGASTTNMGNWGAADTIDVRHEFGHMLGALDEYFTVNGVNWGLGRQATGAIMNNPANAPVARHYDTIRQSAAALTGRSQTTVSQSTPC